MCVSGTTRRIPGVDGTPIFFEREGDGPPIVLCDGLGCDGFIWKYLKDALSPAYEWIHWHYPGHGRSGIPAPRADMSLERLADDLVRVLDHCSAERAVVVGHSLGVQVALEAAHRRPDRVRALVLLCGVHRHLIESIDSRSPLRLVLPILSVAELFFPRPMTRLVHRLPFKVLSRIALMTHAINSRLMRRSDMEAYFRGLSSADLRSVVRFSRSAAVHDAGPYLSQLELPVLIMGGRLDSLTPPERLEETASCIPNAELTLTRRGTHALPVEQPDFVSLRILRFFEERVFAAAAPSTE